MTDMTNFYAYSHGEMRSMVESMDSGAVMAAADPWRRAANTLKQIRTALNTASGDATDSWQGATSDAFYSHMTELATCVNTAAAYSNDAANALQSMSEAIDTAKRNMPEEPGFWDKAGDAISDTAKGAVGVDDEDTRTSIADSRKEQAVGVMLQLASAYRSTTASLKPPPTVPPKFPPPGGSPWVEEHELLQTGAEMIGSVVMGVGAGVINSGASTSTSSASRSSSATVSRPQPPKAAPVIRPTDAGITGGTANALPQPKGPVTGIDGITGGTAVRGGGSTGLGTGGSGLGPGGTGQGFGGPSGGLTGRGEEGLMGGTGLGGTRAGFSGSSVSKAGTFGAGGLGGAGGGAEGGGLGGRAGAGLSGRAGGGLGGRAGGVVGESTHAAGGGRAFSEGGSGIGRSRFGQGAGGAQAGGPGHAGAGQGNGMAGHGAAGKKDKKGGKNRPDYLVEDEETWASGDHVNPNVVE